MQDLLRIGGAWLEGQRRQHMSHWVTYSRLASTHKLRATRGSSSFDLDDGNGGTIRTEAADFIIGKCDLKLDGVLVTPQRGDRITDCSVVYEVLPFDSEPEWRWTDDGRVAYRIHTKQVDEENT